MEGLPFQNDLKIFRWSDIQWFQVFSYETLQHVCVLDIKVSRIFTLYGYLSFKIIASGFMAVDRVYVHVGDTLKNIVKENKVNESKHQSCDGYFF